MFPTEDRGRLRGLSAEIGWAKGNRLSPAEYVAASRPGVDIDRAGEAYTAYDERLRRGRVLDLDDLLARAVELMEQDKAFASGQRWLSRHIFVDEFQDMNLAQFQLIRSWVGEDGDLFTVGDPDQAIYGWNGATASYLSEFDTHFPGATVLRLNANHRSTPAIVRLAAELTNNEAAVALGADVGDGPSLVRYATDMAEARGVMAGVRAAKLRYGTWGSVAVLARSRGRAALIGSQLDSADIPWRHAGGLLSQPEIKFAVGELAKMPASRKMADLGPDLDDILNEAMDLQLGARAYEDSDQEDDPRAVLLRDLTQKNLEHFADLVDEYVRMSPDGDVASFRQCLTYVVRVRGGDITPAADAVTVSTFHAAKGLEWPVVFVVGLEDGVMPDYRSSSGPRLEEERRLLFVAFTRAGRELHCSWAAKRRVRGRELSLEPSRFLSELSFATPRTSTQESLAGVAAAKTAISAAGSAPARTTVGQVEHSLGSWRRAQVRASGATPNAILTDTHIRQIAAIRPTTLAQLEAIIGPMRAHAYGPALLTMNSISERPTA